MSYHCAFQPVSSWLIRPAVKVTGRTHQLNRVSAISVQRKPRTFSVTLTAAREKVDSSQEHPPSRVSAASAASPAQSTLTKQNGYSAPAVPSPTSPALVPQYQPLSPPAGALDVAVSLGSAKAAMSFKKVLLLGVLAGAYIGMAATLALSVGGAVPGIAASNPGLQKMLFGLVGLPFGLTMVLTAGGELFTGNTALVTAALLQRKASFKGLLRNWTASFVGNFIGSLAVVALMAVAGVLTGPSAATAVAIAKAKTSLPFWTALARGVACNWLVCLAVWLASSAKDLPGKFIAVLLPVSAFVAMGLDHSIANMFLIPMGMVSGASAVTVKAFLLNNLLPVTLGNVFGGAILVAAMYHLAYSRA